ncbi:MAG: hypothetical protein LBB05_01385 [Puniceicoccales bacterium]|jgi:hypothetical protein|nr:hypothetical protein [Puniceicoccales bacterium]
MNKKIYCMGLLFSLSLGNSLDAAFGPEEKNWDSFSSNVAQFEKTMAVADVFPPATANRSVSQVQNRKPLAILEVTNIQKIFQCKNILSVFNCDGDVANLILLSMFLLVGRNFSALDVLSKLSIFYFENGLVFVLKPTNDAKKAFSEFLQKEKMPFSEQNSYFIISSNKDCLSAIQKSEDYIKQATISTSKKEDPLKVEYSINVDEVFSGNLKKCGVNGLTIAARCAEDGIEFSGTLSLDSTFKFSEQSEKTRFWELYRALSIEDTRSYCVCQNIEEILEFLKGSAQKLYGNNNFNGLDTVKKCLGETQFVGLFSFGNQLVEFGVGENSCKTVSEYVDHLNSLSDLVDKLDSPSKAIPSAVDQAGSFAPGGVGQKPKVEETQKKKPVSASLICEHKGYPIYCMENKEELWPKAEIESVDYAAMIENLLLTSNSLDFLKLKIDVLIDVLEKASMEKASVENKTSLTTPEDLCLPGMIAKGEFGIVPLIQCFINRISALKKYFPDSSLTQIRNSAGFNFEVTAQKNGTVKLQLFVSNDCLKALPVLIEVANNMFVDFNSNKNEIFNGMIPAKVDETKDQRFIPAKKDNAQKNQSLIPLKTTWNIESCGEARQILLPVKILMEYKVMG